MPCRKIKSPVTGQEENSILWNQLNEINKNESLTDQQYETVLSPDFISKYGDWTKGESNVTVNEIGEPALSVVKEYLDFYSPKELQAKDKQLLEKLIETSRTVVNQPKEDGDNAYFINGREVKRRVTTFIKNLVKNKNFRNRVITEEQKAFEDQLRDWGSKGHADMQFLFSQYLREDGTVELKDGKAVLQRSDDYTSQIDPNNKGIFRKLNEYVQELLASYPAGTVFRVEQTIYAAKRDMAGTMDLTIIQPNGVKDILDWKFTRMNMEKKEKGEDIPWYKQEEWNLQMKEYKRILKEEYGQTDKDFGKTRMIPIILEYSSKLKDGKREYFPSGAEMSTASIKFGEKSYLLPVATQDESTGNKKLDTLIKSLRTLYQTIQDIPASDKRRDLKNEQLNTLFKAVRHLQIEQNFAPLVDQVKVLVEETNRIIEKHIEEFKGKDLSTLSEADISDQAATLLLKAQALHLYQNLDVEFDRIYGNSPTEEQKKILSDLKEVTKEARSAYHRIQEIAGEFTDQYIASRRGVKDILDPEKTVSGLTRSFSLTSELPTGALRTLYLMIDHANNMVAFDMRETMDDLVEIEKEVGEWSKGRDKKAFLSLIKKKTKNDKSQEVFENRLIDEYQQEFYTELKAAIEKGDVKWVKDNIDQQAFKEEIERRKVQGESYLKDVIFSANEEEQNRRLVIAKEQLERETNLSKPEAWLNYYNARRFPLSKWYSKEFQELNKSENAPVLKFYNFIKKWNKEAFDNDYLSAEKQRTFLPYIHKSFSERISLGGEFSFADWVASSVSVHDNAEGYGNFNPLTGQMENYVPVYYTQEIENPEQVSEDLFKNMALFTRAVINYKHKTAIDGQVKMLYYIEQNKTSLQTDRYGDLIRQQGQVVEIPTNERNAELLINHIKSLQYGQKYTDNLDTKLGNWGERYNKTSEAINKKLGFNILPQVSEDQSDKSLSATKAIDLTNRAFILKSMGLNVATSISVFAGGNFQALINSGKWYTRGEFLASEFQHAGHKVFRNDYKYHMALIKTFMPIDEEINREMNRLSLSAVNSQSFSEFLMILMRKADHIVQYSNFLSFMKNTIVIEGKLFNAREYYRNSPEYRARYSKPEAERRQMERGFEERVKALIEEHGLEKKSSVDERGNLLIEGLQNLKNENISRYRTLINSVGRRATGNISPDNEMLMRMNVFYRSMLVFKNWIPALLKQRVGGLRYDASTATWEYGRLRMIFNHLGPLAMLRVNDITHIIKGTDRGVALMREFYQKQREAYQLKTNKELEDLTEEEYMDMMRQALRNQIKELFILMSMMGLLFAIGYFKPDDDEDDEKKNQWKFVKRTIDKVTDEVGFYYSPQQMQLMVNGNIFPSLGLFTDVTSLLRTLKNETIGYAFDNEELQEKTYTLKTVMKTLPISKEATYYIGMFDAELAKELGIRISTESRR